jgi:hypothetical protein
VLGIGSVHFDTNGCATSLPSTTGTVIFIKWSERLDSLGEKYTNLTEEQIVGN